MPRRLAGVGSRSDHARMRNGHTALSPRNIGFAQGEAEAIGGPFWIPRMGFDLDSMGRFGFDMDSMRPDLDSMRPDLGSNWIRWVRSGFDAARSGFELDSMVRSGLDAARSGFDLDWNRVPDLSTRWLR